MITDAFREDCGRAAMQRRDNVRARADRPSQRRCAPEANARSAVLARAKMNIRETDGDTGKLAFEGMATVYEHAYEMYDFWGPYTEVVSAGAGAETLARGDLDVPLVLQHQDLRRIARTTNGSLTLSELDSGLLVLAPELDQKDHDVAYIVPKIRADLVDEMSFKFRITLGNWSPDYTEYRIQKYDIHRGDVAIVGYGANPATSATLRQAKPARDMRKLLLDLAIAG